jgi:formylglycine-generating enzyme required for sulfatase activity/WD40 repeat protein/serine/threonine protein kinase
MSIVSVAALVDELRRHRLLEANQLAELTPGFLARFADPNPGAPGLARELVKRGWLTPYQVNQLFLGRGQELLLGSYVLLDKLGEGGMGAVFKARNWKLGQLVALKLIRKEHIDSESALKRFQREIRAAAQLNHANIVRAYDADCVQGSGVRDQGSGVTGQGSETHFFVMEYVEGIDLSKLVKKNGPLPITEACEYIRQAALGLQHAFERGLVHRDIKPHNLLLQSSTRERGGTTALAYASGSVGIVKILDMGLARIERASADDKSSTTMTQEGAVVGTPDYMAPEQIVDSHRADIRADLYSLGCTFYYLLTGHAPFPGGSLGQKLVKHQLHEPAPLEQERPGTPPAVMAVVRKLMAKRPDDRYQIPLELVSALQNIDLAPVAQLVDNQSDRTLAQSRSQPAASQFQFSGDTAPGSQSPLIKRKKAERRQLIMITTALGAVLVMAAGLLGYLVSGKSGSKGSTEPSVPAPQAKKHTTPEDESTKEEKKRQTAEADVERRAEADEALKPLITKAADAKTTFVELARDVAALKAKYGGTPAAIKASELLMKLPSPLDALDRKKLPQDCIDFWRAERREPPAELVGALGEHRQRHWGLILGLAVSPDGKLIASGGYDNVTRLWDAASLREVTALRDYPGPVYSVAFSSDGRKLLSSSNAQLYDVETGKVLASFPMWCSSLALSQDGRQVITGHRIIRLYDAATGKELRQFEGDFPGTVFQVMFAPDGLTALSCSDKSVRVWSFATGKEIRRFEGHTSAVYCFALSPDGRSVLSAGDDKTVRLWDLETMQERTRLEGCQRPVNFVAWSRDGRQAIAGESYGVIRVWDVSTGKEIRQFGAANVYETHFAMFPDRTRMVSGGSDGTLRLWDVATGKELQPATGPVASWHANIAFSPDDGLVAFPGGDGEVNMWKLGGPVPERVAIRDKHSGGNAHLAFSADGKLLASAAPWPWTNPPAIKVLEGASGTVRLSLPTADKVIALSPDGKLLASGDEDGNAHLWNLATGRQLRIFEVPAGGHKPTTEVAFSPDGRTLAIGTFVWDRALRLCDVNTGRELHAYRGHTSNILTLAFSPDAKTLVSGSDDWSVRLWDVSRGLELHAFSCPFSVNSVAISPDSGLIAAGVQDGSVIIWDAASRNKVREWKLPGSMYGIAFANDGRHLATANANGTVYILRIADGPPRALSAEEAKKGQENEAKRLGVPVQMENSIGMKLNLIPAGRFLMGSPPGKEATIASPFQIGVCEVTQGQYEKVTGSNPSTFSKANGGGADYPVEMVSWRDAVLFCKKLSELPDEKQAGRVYRLPTEAEWEYACRAGTQTAFYFGDDPSHVPKYEWVPPDLNGFTTKPVGRYLPNAFGLFDLCGNVAELCEGAIARGGPIYGGPDLGPTTRYTCTPDSGFRNVGFRIVCNYRPPQITNSIGMKLARIPAGKFLMGSPENEPGRQPNEGPQREVTISRPFLIGVYEVTQAEYEKVTGTNPSKFNKANGGGPDHPVEMASWDDVVAFCKKLSELPDEKKSGRVYRLPTEAEWEYACRAGTRTAYSFGDDASKLGEYAWYGGDLQGQTHAVGQKLPNPWGLYDMLGNLAEWSADWYSDDAYVSASSVDPQGPASGTLKTGRGMGLGHEPHLCRTATRGFITLTERRSHIGFRVVCEVQSAAEKSK